jgi:hypothetical protein
VTSPGGNLNFPTSCAMSVLHRIQIPGGKKPAPLINSMGQWESAAGEVHTFGDGMVQLIVAIDDDHTLHLLCEADQIDKVPAVLARLIGGAQ